MLDGLYPNRYRPKARAGRSFAGAGIQGGLIANVVIGVYGKGLYGHDGKSIKSFLAYRSLA